MALETVSAQKQEPVELAGRNLRLRWEQSADGWRVRELAVKSADQWITLPSPSGLYTVLYLNRHASEKLTQHDKEGTTFSFYPDAAVRRNDHSIEFHKQLPIGELTAQWTLDDQFPGDIHVQMTLVTAKRGEYSLATPTLASFEPGDIRWGMVPGNWYGNSIENDFEKSPEYSQGIPNRSFLAKERNTMTLCPLLTGKNGVTLAVIPDPGTAVDPWEHDHKTRNDDRVGLGTMDRHGLFTPVVYTPILGGVGSKNDAGKKLILNFRYSIQAGDWFPVFRHAAMDIYRFPEILELQQPKRSLSDRLTKLEATLQNDKQSGWKVVKYQDHELGANGTKTSDVGAMWMAARTSGDPILNSRLPYIRQYKLAQQQSAPGFFQWAATGEYPSEEGFVAERGNWIEPLFTTYYTMLDMGNMALFDPKDQEIRERIHLAAEKILQWQHADGSFDVAYDNMSHRLAFPTLMDLRPTWYGFVVAWKVLGDQRYLAAARKGADWYLREAVSKGRYLGACGDALNIWDFTTVFGAQALLDLYTATGDEKYRDGAINVAKVYATSIFTHPIPTEAVKTIGGKDFHDWQISQVGLSVEHIRGTAQGGPILLSSHAGLFVRMYELTGEDIFLDMARSAARGREYFEDPTTGMAIYYWASLENVAGVVKLFPWHAEWQIGWITDYLMSEAHLRSKGQVSFPAGFPTPKVGSHVTYGFAPGTIYGQQAELLSPGKAVACDNPNVEYVCALSTSKQKLFVLLMNQKAQEQTLALHVDRTQEARGRRLNWSAAQSLNGGTLSAQPETGEVKTTVPAWGLTVIALDLSN